MELINSAQNDLNNLYNEYSEPKPIHEDLKDAALTLAQKMETERQRVVKHIYTNMIGRLKAQHEEFTIDSTHQMCKKMLETVQTAYIEMRTANEQVGRTLAYCQVPIQPAGVDQFQSKKIIIECIADMALR